MRISRFVTAASLVMATVATASAQDSSSAKLAHVSFYPNLPARFWSHSSPALGWQIGWTGYVTEGVRQCGVVGRSDDVQYMAGGLDSLELGGAALPFPGNRALDSTVASPGFAWHRTDLARIKNAFEGC